MDNNKYLIIGGSTKCGTTSLFHYFEFHPQVCPCTMKESRYFWKNEYPLAGVDRDMKNYATFDSLFQKCNSDKIRIEATPDYLYSPTSASAIKSELINCKFVFILRDPIERLLSWFKFAKLNGIISTNVTLESYIRTQLNKNIENASQEYRSLEQGNYFPYINEYIKKFGKENILITYYEDLSSDPRDLCEAICNFTGIKSDYFDGFDFKIFNKSVATKSVGAHQLFRKLKRTIRPATRLLNSGFRKHLKSGSYQFEKAFTSVNKLNEKEELGIEPATYSELIQYFSSDVKKLQSLTGKVSPWQNFTSL